LFVDADRLLDRGGQRLLRHGDFQPDRAGAVVEPVDVLFEAKDFAVVDANPLEHAIPVEQSVVVDADFRLGLVEEFAVDPDAGRRGHGSLRHDACAKRESVCAAGTSTRPAVIRTTRSVPATNSRLW